MPASPSLAVNWAPTRALPHQHEVDIESEDLAAHVNAVGMREVLTQVGEGACCTLEVSTGDLHALGGERRRMARGRARELPRSTPTGQDVNSGALEMKNTQHLSLLCPMSHPLPHLSSPPQTLACPWPPTWSAAPLGSQRTQCQNYPGAALRLPHAFVEHKAGGAVLSLVIRELVQGHPEGKTHKSSPSPSALLYTRQMWEWRKEELPYIAPSLQVQS